MSDDTGKKLRPTLRLDFSATSTSPLLQLAIRVAPGARPPTLWKLPSPPSKLVTPAMTGWPGWATAPRVSGPNHVKLGSMASYPREAHRPPSVAVKLFTLANVATTAP